MNEATIIQLTNEALMLSIYVSAPPIILAMIAGLLIALFQALTQVQEPTTTFVVKALVVWFTLIIIGSSLAASIANFAKTCFTNFPNIVQ